MILAILSINSAKYQKQVDAIIRLGIEDQTIPSYAEVVSGKARLTEVRDIAIGDILGMSREPPNPELLGKSDRGQSILVPGGR